MILKAKGTPAGWRALTGGFCSVTTAMPSEPTSRVAVGCPIFPDNVYFREHGNYVHMYPRQHPPGSHVLGHKFPKCRAKGIILARKRIYNKDVEGNCLPTSPGMTLSRKLP